MKRIWVWDRYETYGIRLVNYCNRECEGNVVACAFQTVEQVIDHLPEKESFFLVHESLLGSLDSKWLERLREEQRLMVLVEHEARREWEVNRYERAPTIVKQLVAFLSRTTSGKEEGEMIGVIAVQDSKEKTAFAKQLAGNKRALYWELLPISSDYSDGQKTEQLLYEIKGRGLLRERFQEEYLLWREGHNVLPATRMYLDWRDLKKEDVSYFFQFLKESGYGIVVIDLSLACLPDTEFLKELDQIRVFSNERSLANEEGLKNFLKLAGIMESKVVWDESRDENGEGRGIL